MTVTAEHRYSNVIFPIHAVLLAGALPLFLGAALSDMAYASTYEIQWNNFSSWLIIGGLFFSGFALLFTIVDLVRPTRRVPGAWLYAAFLLIAWVVGFFNALMHARDAWASMPAGLVMSLITTLFIALATWVGFCTPRIGGVK